MSQTAIILKHSKAAATGAELISIEAHYPRFIHSELMTHRVFSRNAASSRAIPINRMLEAIRRNPAMPVRWGKNGKGMQDHGELSEADEAHAKNIWLSARDDALDRVAQFLQMESPPHKQIVNRILEPWQHIKVVITGTKPSFANFMALRRHPDADPTMQALAEEIFKAIKASTPTILRHGEWHLPYIDDYEIKEAMLAPNSEEVMQALLKVSVARCARTSYKDHRNKVATLREDIDLYNKLVVMEPLHASPAEHQATPDEASVIFKGGKITRVYKAPEHHGNLTGFVQLRKLLPNEFVGEYDWEAA